MADESAAISIALKFLDQATAPMKQSLDSIDGMLKSTKGAVQSLVGAWSIKEFLGIGDNYQRSLVQMQTMWGDTTNSMIAQSKAMSNEFGKYFSFTEISQSMIKTKDVMDTLGLGTQRYMDLVSRSGDIAAVKQMGLEEAMRFVEKAAMGNKRAAMELGAVVTDDYMRYTAFGGALQKTWSRLDEGSKAYYRVQEIMNQTTQYMGMAKTMADTTLDGAIKKLGTTIKAELGPDVASMVRDISGNISSLVPPVKTVTQSISSLLSVYSQFPDEVKGAAGTGVILRILTGSWAPAQLLVFLGLFDSTLKKVNELSNIGLPTSADAEKSWEKLQKAYKAFQGGEESMRQFFREQAASGDLLGKTHIEGKLPLPPGYDPHKDVLKPGSGVGDISASVAAIEAKAHEVAKTWSDQFDEIQILMAKMAGEPLKAELIGVDKWATDTADRVWKMISEAQIKYNTLAHKAAEKGTDATAQALMVKGQQELNDAWQIGLDVTGRLIPNMQKLKYSDAAKSDYLNTQKTIADLAVQYAQLSDTRQGQFRAETYTLQIEQAKQLQYVQQNSEQWYAITRLYSEKIRQSELMATGSFADGLNEGIRQWRNSLPSAAEQGVNAMKTLTGSINSSADALADFTMTGKMNFGDFANSVIKDMLRMYYTQQLNQGLNWIFGAFGIGNNLPSSFTMPSTPNYDNFMSNADISNIFGGGRATGGPVDPNHIYWVGEKGPEPFIPKTAGTIIPNNRIGGQSNTYIIKVDVTPPVDASGRVDSSGAKKYGTLMGDAVKARLNEWGEDNMRSGGMFNPGLSND